jgi:hypothetical protein
MDNIVPIGLWSDKPFYTAHFMDDALWEPFVRRLCEQHGFGCRRVRSGSPGTFPTFVVELELNGSQLPPHSVVVKFFGPLFEGFSSYRIEREMGLFLAQQPLLVRSPAILAQAQLDQEWWYLIFEGISGVSIGQVRQSISADAWAGVAEQMGAFIKALHTVTATALPVLAMQISAKGWSGFVDFLEMQRVSCLANHQRWGDLPPHLLSQVQGFLLPVDQLLDLSSPPHLIHADLTSDHLLGRLVPNTEIPPVGPHLPLPAGAGWDSLAIIDWGDTRIGNVLYEMVALYLDLLQGDKRLLNICLEAYGLTDFYKNDFPRKALCQFPIPAGVYEPHQDAATLDELAERLFGL